VNSQVKQVAEVGPGMVPVLPPTLWISHPWKTQGSGLPFCVSWGSKGVARLPQGALARRVFAMGNYGEHGGKTGFLSSP
jgi:hypothetical protein